MSVPELPLKYLVDPARSITYGIVQAGEDVADGVPYIRPVDMTEASGVPDPDALRRTAPEIAATYRRSEVRRGDLVVSIGPSFGKIMVVPEALGGANLTQGTARVAPGRRVYPGFLYWALQSAPVRSQWDAAVGGATFRALNLEPLGLTRVPVPPLEEQRRIADFLATETALLDSLTRKKQQLLERTEERLRSALETAMAAQGWRRPALSHLLARRVSDGPHETPEFVDEGVPFLSVDAFVNDGLNFDGCRHVRAEDHRRYSQKAQPRRGDVLMTKAASIGRVARVDTDREFNVWSPVAILRPNSALLRADYLAQALRTDDLQTQMQLAATSNTQQNLAMGDIGSLRLPLPPLPEQERIAVAGEQRLLRQRALRRLVAEQVSRLAERRQALITAAVTGQIDVTTARRSGVS